MLVCTKALHIRHIFYNFMYVCGGTLTMYHGWVLICNQHLHVLLMAYPYMMSELVPTFALLLSVQYCHFSTTIYAAKYSQYYCKHVFHCLYSVYLSSRPTNSLSWDIIGHRRNVKNPSHIVFTTPGIAAGFKKDHKKLVPGWKAYCAQKSKGMKYCGMMCFRISRNCIVNM